MAWAQTPTTTKNRTKTARRHCALPSVRNAAKRLTQKTKKRNDFLNRTSIFDQVRIKIKHMEIEIRRRESTGSGASLCASVRSEHTWSMRKYTRPYPARMHAQGCDCAPPSSPLAQADDSVFLDPSKCP